MAKNAKRRSRLNNHSSVAGLREAKQRAGGGAALARIAGVSRQAVNKWRVIPVECVPAIEHGTGLSRRKLRPDFF